MRNDLDQNEGFGSMDGDDSPQMTDVLSMMPSALLKLNERATLSV